MKCSKGLIASDSYFLKYQLMVVLLTTTVLIFCIRAVRLSIAAPHQVDTGITAPELIG